MAVFPAEDNLMSRPADESLENLVGRAKAGDRGAFSTIVRQLMNQVAALTYRMTGDRDTALDLAQETFVSAWQNLGGYRGEADFTHWITRIATNKSLNLLKAARKFVDAREAEAVIAGETSPAAGQDTALERRELSDRVLAFMDSLPPQQRAVFELRFYQQMTFDQIAEATGRAVGTVKTNYREAVKKLRILAQETGLRS